MENTHYPRAYRGTYYPVPSLDACIEGIIDAIINRDNQAFERWNLAYHHVRGGEFNTLELRAALDLWHAYNGLHTLH